MNQVSSSDNPVAFQSSNNKKDNQADLDLASIRSPDQKASERLWLIIVVSLAIVLVGTFLTLAIGVLVLVLSKSASDAELQLLLTMFTMAVAFLAGLLTPSPMQRKASNQ